MMFVDTFAHLISECKNKNQQQRNAMKNRPAHNFQN